MDFFCTFERTNQGRDALERTAWDVPRPRKRNRGKRRGLHVSRAFGSALMSTNPASIRSPSVLWVPPGFLGLAELVESSRSGRLKVSDAEESRE
jgi:hypothetical protein